MSVHVRVSRGGREIYMYVRTGAACMCEHVEAKEGHQTSLLLLNGD